MALQNKYAGRCHWCGGHAPPGSALLQRYGGRWYMVHNDTCLDERNEAGASVPNPGPNYENDHEYATDVMMDYAFADMGIGWD